MILLDLSHHSLKKMRSCLWKLEPGFWTYGWIRLLGPSGPNVLSRSQAPSSRNFLKFHDFIGFISSFLRKWLDTSFGSKWPKCAVFRLQVPRSRQFLRFHDFIGFISSFMRKWGPICENWSQGSGLMLLWLDMSFGPMAQI